MREHSMLFKPDMIQLIRQGIKTQTRRLNHRTIAPGDRIYVKEGHYRFGEWKKNGVTKTGKQKWKFQPKNPGLNFRYLDAAPLQIEPNANRQLGWYKRSPLFMEKKFARYWLDVIGVKNEPLQSITEQDVKAEGAGEKVRQFALFGLDKAGRDEVYRIHFRVLWERINGRESWELNSVVQVITFKNITA